MSRIVAVESLSLDGVMQAPGRAGEDTRGGFAHGGWAAPFKDAVMGKAMMQGMAQAGPLLFGRRTYEDFFSVWPHRTDNPYTAVLNNSQKYVASTTLAEPLPWQNSTLLDRDAVGAVGRLKQQLAKDIVVLGSGELVRSLLQARLVDELILLIHPILLGSGRRLFPAADGAERADLTLAGTRTTGTGVVVATYRAGA